MRSNNSKSERLWSPQFITLMVSAIFMYVAAFMFNPTLPLFARAIGLTDPSIGGFLVLAYTTGSLLPRLFWGNMSDRRGRKPVYVIGLLIMVLCIPLFPVFPVLAGLILIRFVQGTGFSATSTSAGTIAVDLVPGSRRAEGIGYYALANTMGMALGPAIGTSLMQQRGTNGLLLVGAIFGIFSLVASIFIRYEKQREEVAATAPVAVSATASATVDSSPTSPGAVPASASRKGIHGFYTDRRVLKTALIAFFIVFPYGGIIGYIISYGSDLGIANIGMYFTAYAASVFAIRLFIGRFSDRHGAVTVLAPSFLFIAAGMGILYFAHSLPIFLLSAVLFGFGFGAAIPVLQATAFGFAAPDRRGAVSATLTATMDLAYGLGAVFLGIGVKEVGYAIAFVGSAVVEIIGLVVLFLVLVPELSERVSAGTVK